MGLEDFYIGDGAFQQLARAAAPEWARCSCKEPLLALLGGDLDLAMVIYANLGENALAWMSEKVPALEGLTPGDCMQTDWGRRRLKECLARMR